MPLCAQCSKFDWDGCRTRKLSGRTGHKYDRRIHMEYYVDGVESGSDRDDDWNSNKDAQPREDWHITGHGLLPQEWQRSGSQDLAKGTQPKEICDLCVLIERHIEKNQVWSNESIEVLTAPYCSTINKGGEYVEIFRLNICAKPEINFIGPVEPHEQDSASKVNSRYILELQRCSSPIPDTSDHDVQVPEGASKNTSDRFSGRRTSQKASLGLVSKWKSICTTLHGENCRQSILTLGDEGLSPFLVIDVERMSVIDAPTNCQYAALSYCWGRASMLKHLVANSAALRTPGALKDAGVPARISDAIEVVRGIGERYLWVDALCIVQDDETSKQAQLAQMGLIYSLAAFTIVAASGSDANAGLPGVRAGTRNIDQTHIRVGQTDYLTVIDGFNYYGGVKTAHWATRAWTMQEVLLSKKLLVFTDQQIYWKCGNATWLEEVVLENVFSMKFQRHPITFTLGLRGDLKHMQLYSTADKEYSLYIEELYEILVSEYRKRQLTFQSDILNAFSGLCQAMASPGNESFHWGLPVSRFGAALCWRLRGGGTRNFAECDNSDKDLGGSSTPFPSWSWAAWHGNSPHSAISWVRDGYDGQLQLEENIITYYCHDKTGEMRRLQPSSSIITTQVTATPNKRSKQFYRRLWLRILGRLRKFHRVQERSAHPQNHWRQEPEIILKAARQESLNTGLLYFWTSTATLYLIRITDSLGTNFPHLCYPLSLLDIQAFVYEDKVYIDDIPTISQFKDPQDMPNLPKDVVQRLEGFAEKRGGFDDERYLLLALDFVIVSRHKNDLCALAVKWDKGIAYRVGILEVLERRWVELQNRVWKQVILG